eukprot:m.159590 g.159590  ORF g.159590 m.159590 type:complete len:57 (+) comp53017_c0_seq1:114-284(+)
MVNCRAKEIAMPSLMTNQIAHSPVTMKMELTGLLSQASEDDGALQKRMADLALGSR